MWRLCRWCGKNIDIQHCLDKNFFISFFFLPVSFSLGLCLCIVPIGWKWFAKHTPEVFFKTLLFAACDYYTLPLLPNHIMSAPFMLL